MKNFCAAEGTPIFIVVEVLKTVEILKKGHKIFSTVAAYFFQKVLGRFSKGARPKWWVQKHTLLPSLCHVHMVYEFPLTLYLCDFGSKVVNNTGCSREEYTNF